MFGVQKIRCQACGKYTECTQVPIGATKWFLCKACCTGLGEALRLRLEYWGGSGGSSIEEEEKPKIERPYTARRIKG